MTGHELRAVVLWAVISGNVSAAADNTLQNNPAIRIATREDKGSELQLEVRQAPLGEVLNQIAVKTKIPIHYSILPEGLVTATCVGPGVKNVLECLIGSKVDLVFRYAPAGNKDQPAPVSEAWLLGTNITIAKVTAANCPAVVGQQQEPEPVAGPPIDTTQEMREQSNRLLEQAKSKDPAQRAEALANLGTGGVKDDPKIRQVLEQAMTDKNPGIRAQAVGAMADLDADSASEVLGRALQDNSIEVRIAAVDKAGSNVGILERATTDSNATVSGYAAAKLAELNRKQGR